MKIHVFDTHVTTITGKYMHFDVLVDDDNAKKVDEFVTEYLTSKGIEASQVKTGICNFCHSEIANPQVQETVKQKGHFILPLNGC